MNYSSTPNFDQFEWVPSSARVIIIISQLNSAAV